MNIVKNKEGFAIFATRFALVVEFFLLGRYVYDVIMKEILVAPMAVPGFFLLFVLGYLLFGLFADKYRSSGTLSGICLMFWGFLVVLIPFLSIDRTILLMPVIKINSHSLYLTYIMAGLGALTGVFAGGFFRSFGAFTIAQDRNYPLYSGAALVSALTLQALAPTVISYEVIFYAAAGLLFLSGISLDKAKPLTPQSSSIQAQGGTVITSKERIVPSVLSTSLGKGILLASLTLVGASLREYLSLQLGYGSWSLLLILGLPLVITLLVVPFLRNGGFTEKDLVAPFTTLYLLSLMVSFLFSTSVITVIFLGVAVFAIFAVAFTVQQRERSTVSLLIKIGGIFGGYYLGGWVVTTFGELVQFTSKRFYYIPPREVFLAGALIALPVVVGLWIARRKRG